MDLADIKFIADALTPILKSELGDPLKELQRLRIEERLTALENDQKAMSYMGVWQRAIEYKKNNSVTHEGSLWIAVRDNPTTKPGNGDDWQLAAKRGADGKDAR